MTDIVERLREILRAQPVADNTYLCGLLGEAADEIERLRGDLQASEEFAEEYRQVRDQNADEIERLRDMLGRTQEEAGELLHAKQNLHGHIKRLEDINSGLEREIAKATFRAEIAKLRGALEKIAKHSSIVSFTACADTTQADIARTALQKDEGE